MEVKGGRGQRRQHPKASIKRMMQICPQWNDCNYYIGAFLVFQLSIAIHIFNYLFQFRPLLCFRSPALATSPPSPSVSLVLLWQSRNAIFTRPTLKKASNLHTLIMNTTPPPPPPPSLSTTSHHRHHPHFLIIIPTYHG